MKPNHHLDAATLLGYSAGALPAAFMAVAATHLSLCQTCRQRLHDADGVGGLLVQQQEPAPLGARLEYEHFQMPYTDGARLFTAAVTFTF